MSVETFEIERELWIEHLTFSAREVFETMLGSTVEPARSAMQTYEVTAVVGLAGVLSGNFLVRCSRRGLGAIGKCMLGSEVTEAECIDAMGEVCNMLAGSWKRRIPDLADGCMLSVPTVITGNHYKMHSPDVETLLKEHFVFSGETVCLQLQVQK